VTAPVAVVPHITVEADGASLSSADVAALAEVRVRQVLSAPAQCELTFADPPGPLDIAARLGPGTRLRVAAAGQPEPLFVGDVTAIGYVYEAAQGRQLRVRAYDVLHRLRKRQPVRLHVEVGADDLARELVADVGLTVEAQATAPTWPRLIQHGQSDFELVRELAERSGLYLTVRDDVLHLVTLEGLGDPVELTLGQNLHEARIEVNGDRAARSVRALGWDPLRAEQYEATGSGARSGGSVTAEADPGALGGSPERTIVDALALDATHASGLAQADLDGRTGDEVTVSAVCDGDTRLRPAARISLKNVDAPVAGTYVVTEAVHTMDPETGFLSHVSTAPPVRAPTAAASATIGIVSNVDDPEHIGRVQVTLPTFGDLASSWMEVCSVAAGAGKGLVALPDVGDRVLVLLPHADPAYGVVLGGLYGADGPPDAGVDGSSVKRYTFTTSGGQAVTLDDGETTTRIEDATGNEVELGPQRMLVHAAVDLTIEAPGRAITVRGRSIDFQTG